jgi:hypothetical protein
MPPEGKLVYTTALPPDQNPEEHQQSFPGGIDPSADASQVRTSSIIELNKCRRRIVVNTPVKKKSAAASIELGCRIIQYLSGGNKTLQQIFDAIFTSEERSDPAANKKKILSNILSRIRVALRQAHGSNVIASIGGLWRIDNHFEPDNKRRVQHIIEMWTENHDAIWKRPSVGKDRPVKERVKRPYNKKTNPPHVTSDVKELKVPLPSFGNFETVITILPGGAITIRYGGKA